MQVTDAPTRPGGGRPQPQRLLLCMLGEFWVAENGPLPSAFLVRLLGDVGMSPQNARAAVHRLARRGLLEPSKRGRRSYYGITERCTDVLTEGYRRIFGSGAEGPAWDGSWTVVAFSVPEARRETRHLLRTGLRWRGFAPLHDAVWVAVGDRSAPAESVLEALDIRSATIVVGRASGPADACPVTAWKLDELRAGYEAFLDSCEPMRARAASGEIAPTEALRSLASMIVRWRTLAATDPDLPGELLPANWPQGAARRLFLELVQAMRPLAALRVRQLLALDEPELVPLVRHKPGAGAAAGSAAGRGVPLAGPQRPRDAVAALADQPA